MRGRLPIILTVVLLAASLTRGAWQVVPPAGDNGTNVPAAAGSAAVRGGLASALEAVTRIPGTTELWAVGWQDNFPQVIRHG